MKPAMKYIKIIANLLAMILVLFLIFYIGPKVVVFFMPFVVGAIISWIANPMVRFLEKRLKVVRKYSTFIIIVGVLALVILILYLAVSKLVDEGLHLLNNLPNIYGGISADFETIGENMQVIIKRLPDNIADSITNLASSLTGALGSWIRELSAPTFAAAGNFAKNVPGMLIAVIMAILSAYFFTADREMIVNLIGKTMPKGVMANVLKVWRDLKHVVGGYFKAQFKIMLVVYVIVVIGLLILRVDYVLLVGLCIAFLDMLPFFGTGTILGPWSIIKILSGDYKMAIALIVLYAVTQVVRQLIQPKLVSDSIGMNPLLTLLSMYIGFKWGGVIGMIIAVPIGMILINLFKGGVFENQIRGIKELVKDFNEWRKW